MYKIHIKLKAEGTQQGMLARRCSALSFKKIIKKTKRSLRILLNISRVKKFILHDSVFFLVFSMSSKPVWYLQIFKENPLLAGPHLCWQVIFFLSGWISSQTSESLQS